MPFLGKLEGTGFPVWSRCLAAQGVDRLSTQVLGGSFLALVFLDQNFSPPVLLTRALTSAPSGFEASMIRLRLALSSFCADRSKKRLGLWKKMLEVLRCHKHVPEAEEALLLDIADQEGVKDNEEGLEGWTANQLLHKASERATNGFEILTQAVEDIVSALSSRGHHKFRIRCSNITQWRTETQRWLQAQDDDVTLVQETHLRRGALQDAVAAMHKVGFEVVGGEAFSTARHGTKGGVAVLTKTHIQSRVMQHFTVEGCGFCAVDPNAEIMARLVAVIKYHSGQWLIAGDFNLSPSRGC